MTIHLTNHEPASRTLPDTDWSAYHERASAVGRDFVNDVDRILPIIAAGAAQSEAEGRVPDRSVEAMTEVGVFRALVPTQWGGLEMHPAVFFEGIMKIASADSSAAWIGGQLNVHSFEIALMDERAQADFWKDGPDTRASSSYAPVGSVKAVDGGYVLDGRWPFSSGVDHAQWVIIGSTDRTFVVPVSDLTIDHGSWNVSGLKGTGSKTLHLSNVFVPEYRAHKLADTYADANPGWAVNDRPLYWLSWLGIFNSTIPNSTIGAALGGLETFVAQSRLRLSKQGTGAAVSENPFLHLKLASALTHVKTVRARHLENWRDLFAEACRGRRASPLERMRIRFEASDAAATCFDAVSDVWPLMGANAIEDKNPLQRTFRDLMAMRNHGSAALEASAVQYMRTMFGYPPAPFKDFGTLAWYR